MPTKQDTLLVALAIFLCLFGFALYALYSPSAADSPKDYPDEYDKRGIYRFEPKTILDALRQGDANIFLPPSKSQSTPSSVIPLYWQQENFQYVAHAVHQFVWDESLEGWNLYRVSFTTNCRDYSKGFYFANMTYFKIISLSGKTEYTLHDIEINLEDKEIFWGEKTNYPFPKLGWKSIDLEKIGVTAEEAVKIADANGGRSLRLSAQKSAQDGCRINATFFPSGYDFYGWRVTYGDGEVILIPVE